MMWEGAPATVGQLLALGKRSLATRHGEFDLVVARCLQEPRDFCEALEGHSHHVNFNAEFTLFRPCANCPLGIGISNLKSCTVRPR